MAFANMIIGLQMCVLETANAIICTSSSRVLKQVLFQIFNQDKRDKLLEGTVIALTVCEDPLVGKAFYLSHWLWKNNIRCVSATFVSVKANVTVEEK
jgi:hypothetical protein